jgi:hypothetical protein
MVTIEPLTFEKVRMTGPLRHTEALENNILVNISIQFSMCEETSTNKNSE